jgi:hypothetical protein
LRSNQKNHSLEPYKDEAMPERAKTDDDIGRTQRAPVGGTVEQREWIRTVLGIDLTTLLALDLQTTTSQSSVEQAVPMLLQQLKEILTPLTTLPAAQAPELSAALLSAHNIRTELTAKPTPSVIVAMRREIAALPGLVNTAIAAVTRLQQRQQTLIEQARELNHTKEASEDSEGELIQTFRTEKAAVANAFSNGPLTAIQIKTAETALQAAVAAADEIAKAVQLRLNTILTKLVLAASELAFSKDADEELEGGLIGSFTERRSGVSVAQSKSTLSLEDIRQAQQALEAAQGLRDQIDEAVAKRLAERRLALIEEAKQVRYSVDAREQEGGLIGSFEQQLGVVTQLPESGLTAERIRQAEAGLEQARETAKAIDNAVQQRHTEWAENIRERADRLMDGFASNDIDPALWAAPKATREEIDVELVPS